MKSDEVGACGCVTWVPKEDARRELFDGDDCEDAADEVVAAVAEVANGIKSCAELKLIGACEHEVAKMHCPASCGLCDELGAERREMGAPRRILGKCR